MAIHPTAVVSPNAEIGKNVEIGPYAIIDDDVRIGDDCFIDAHVKIGQYTTIGPRCRIYFGAFVGGMSVFHQNIRIGDMAIISGFSASRQDILPYSKGDGRPPVPRGINVVAMKRRGVPQEIRTAVNDAFKLLISEDYNTTQAIEKIKAEIPMNEYIENMIEFIKTSKRGVLLKSHKNCYHASEGGEDE